jgi:hypothetical protein
LLLLATKLDLKVLQMKLKSFDGFDNLTQTQQSLIKGCLATTKEERELAVRNWEKQIVIDEIDFSSSRLIPYFFYGNQQHGIISIYDKRMKVIYKHWWLRSQHISHQLQKVHTTFIEAGIGTVVIKGASIKTYYERDELRPMADFDILIPRADLKRALQLLKELDYITDKRIEAYLSISEKNILLDFNHAITCVHSKNDCQIDLHWRVGSRCSNQFSDNLWLNLENYELLPNAKRPQLAYEVFMIIIHAVDSRNKDNLNWIIDIAVINESRGGSFWQEARRIAVAEKKEDLFDYGCSILIKMGISAPDPGIVKKPKNLVAILPEEGEQVNLIKMTYAKLNNLYGNVDRLFPHSNIANKLYQVVKFVYYYFATRKIRSIKP